MGGDSGLQYGGGAHYNGGDYKMLRFILDNLAVGAKRKMICISIIMALGLLVNFSFLTNIDFINVFNGYQFLIMVLLLRITILVSLVFKL
jgi:hypothetical protein